MVGSDPDQSGGAPDVFELFCHYNSLYFRDSLGSCAVSWAEEPLPDRDHGSNFRKLMNTINLSSVADPHRPVDGYRITQLHEIRKKYYHYKCQSCGDLIKSTMMRVPSGDDCIERKGVDDPCQNSKCHWHRHKQQCPGSYRRVQESLPGCPKVSPCSQDPGDNNKLEIVLASRPEERSRVIQGSNGVAGNQAADESMSCPVDSSIRGEIVDISDG
nr:unnamed protein product [Digitaria exilis]